MITMNTRSRHAAEPSFPEFLSAKIGGGPVRISDDFDPDWSVDIITVAGCLEFWREFLALPASRA